MSATGAKLTCSNAQNIPDVFRLMVSADNTIRPAKVAWRKDGLVGIHFTGEAKSAVLRRG